MRRRWQLVQGLAENRWGNGVVDPRGGLGSDIRNVGQAADAWAARLVDAPAGGPVAQAILAGLAVDPARPLDAGKPADTTNLLRRILAFTAMSAEFQSS
jgi:hypothetical protein